jgi:hypothetical protein
MRFRPIVVAVVHVIVTAGQYIGRTRETSTTREIAEGAEETGTSATANHGETESRRFLIRRFQILGDFKTCALAAGDVSERRQHARRFQSIFE